MSLRAMVIILLAVSLVSAGCGSNHQGAPSEANRNPLPSRSEVTSPATAVDIAFVDMVNQSTGWAMSPDGRMLRTADGGQSWTDITPFHVGSRPSPVVHGLGAFDGVDRAWYLDLDTNTIYASWDGGNNWDMLAQIEPDISNDGGEILSFADSQHGWIEVMSGAHHDRAEIFTTEDGGRTWTEIYQGHVAGDLSFISSSNGWLSTGAMLYKSIDGGHTWQAVGIPNNTSSWVGLPVQLGSKLILPAVREGSDGPQLTILSSDGTGALWKPLFAEKERSAKAAILSVATELHVWVATVDGSIGFRTDDAGTHWTQFSLPQGFDVVELNFVSPSKGWMVARDQQSFAYTLFKTDDGGQTWRKVAPSLQVSKRHDGARIANHVGTCPFVVSGEGPGLSPALHVIKSIRLGMLGAFGWLRSLCCKGSCFQTKAGFYDHAVAAAV